jgi:hypothetical protein
MGTLQQRVAILQKQLPHIHWRPIMVIALAARVLAGGVTFHFSPVPGLTSWGYENIAIALSLHAGHGFGSPFFSPSGPTALIPPGYPLLLAGIMSLFGTGVAAATAAIALQILFSLSTVGVVMHIALSHFDVRTANFAGFLCAVCPPMLMAPLIIWDTCLSALLLAVVLWAAPVLSGQRLGRVVLGAICGVAALVNPALLPCLIAICAFSAWQARKIPWAGILTFLIVFSPWPLRNAVVMHSFIPLRNNFGDELWIGNHPGGNGDTNGAMNPMLNADEREAFLSMGELRFLRERGEQSKAYIRAQPGLFVRRTLKRVWEFWMGTAPGQGGGSTAALFLPACAGLALLWKRRRLFLLYALPLILYPLPYYVTHADVRYQYVIDPLLAILAAYAIEAFLTFMKPAASRGTPSMLDAVN